MHKKFRLLAPLPVEICGVIRPIPLIHHIPIDLIQMRYVVVPTCETSNSVAV